MEEEEEEEERKSHMRGHPPAPGERARRARTAAAMSAAQARARDAPAPPVAASAYMSYETYRLHRREDHRQHRRDHQHTKAYRRLAYAARKGNGMARDLATILADSPAHHLRHREPASAAPLPAQQPPNAGKSSCAGGDAASAAPSPAQQPPNTAKSSCAGGDARLLRAACPPPEPAAGGSGEHRPPELAAGGSCGRRARRRSPFQLNPKAAEFQPHQPAAPPGRWDAAVPPPPAPRAGVA